MTVKEVAKLAGVTTTKVQNWIKDGRLPADRRQMGKRNHHVVRINRDDYDRFAAAPKVKSHLTIGKIAKLEGVSEDVVRRWIHSGLLAADRRPGATSLARTFTTIDPTEYQRFVQSRKQEEQRSTKSYLTIEEIAALEAVSRTMVRLWIDRKLLAAEHRPIAPGANRYFIGIDPAEYKRFSQLRKEIRT